MIMATLLMVPGSFQCHAVQSTASRQQTTDTRDLPVISCLLTTAVRSPYCQDTQFYVSVEGSGLRARDGLLETRLPSRFLEQLVQARWLLGAGTTAYYALLLMPSSIIDIPYEYMVQNTK